MASRIPPLRTGHALQLLEGSAAFFPALVQAIDAARQEVLLETYIFDVTGSYHAAFLNGIGWNLLNLCITGWLFLRLRRVRAQAGVPTVVA